MGMKHNKDMETEKGSMEKAHQESIPRANGAKSCKPTRTLTFQSDFLRFSWRLSVLLLSVLIRDVKGVTVAAAASDRGGGRGDHNTGGECIGREHAWEARE